MRSMRKFFIRWVSLRFPLAVGKTLGQGINIGHCVGYCQDSSRPIACWQAERCLREGQSAGNLGQKPSYVKPNLSIAQDTNYSIYVVLTAP